MRLIYNISLASLRNIIDYDSLQVSLFRELKSTECERHTIKKNVRPVQQPQGKLDLIYVRSHKQGAN